MNLTPRFNDPSTTRRQSIFSTGLAATALAFSFCLLSTLARGDVAWDVTEQTLPPDAQARVMSATFTFRNSSSKSFSFEELKTSCRCVTARAGKKEYAAGERGEVVMTIDRQGRSSNQVESTHVTGSDGSRMSLTMRIQAAQFLKVTPGFLVWKRTDATVSKEFRVEVTDRRAAVKKLMVTSDDPNFDIVVNVGEDEHCRVIVTPKGNIVTKVVTFTIQADFPKGNPGRAFVYAKIL